MSPADARSSRPLQVQLLCLHTALVFHACQLGNAVLYRHLETFLSTGYCLFLMSLTAVASALLEVPTGRLGDRYGPRASLLVAFLAHAVCSGLMLLTSSAALCTVGFLLEGLGFACMSGSDKALMRALCDAAAKADGGGKEKTTQQAASDALYYKHQALTTVLQNGALLLSCALVFVSDRGVSAIAFAPAAAGTVQVTFNLLAAAILYWQVPGEKSVSGVVSVDTAATVAEVWQSLPLHAKLWVVEYGVWGSVPHLLKYHAGEQLLPPGLARITIATGGLLGGFCAGRLNKSRTQNSVQMTRQLPWFATTHVLMAVFLSCIGALLVALRTPMALDGDGIFPVRHMVVAGVCLVVPCLISLQSVEVTTRITRQVKRDVNTVLNMSGIILTLQFTLTSLPASALMDKTLPHHGLNLCCYAVLVAAFAVAALCWLSWTKETCRQETGIIAAGASANCNADAKAGKAHAS